jgi:hypothetical protein
MQMPSSEQLPCPPLSARSVYFDLFNGDASTTELDNAASFLQTQLAVAASLDSDLPEAMDGLSIWMEQGVESVGQRYRSYLEERANGGERRYFRDKAHALFFLKSVAPTKMVDGAWLYGLLPRWQDPRFSALVQTYLEELGEGLTSKNHIVLYRKLLASQGIEHWDDLSDEHYIQGAIQLTLAYNADQFLPEIIGFNLGYEQLPLHLLITAYELKELGIDPYYFTLHITVDNADSGHAKQAVDSVCAAMPRLGDADEYWQRVRNGYKLNLLGASTNSVIDSFDLEQEMLTIFRRKSSIGKFAHSDYRRVAGRTVNDWLADPTEISRFTDAMEDEGWFKRHQDPQDSRFWKLIHGEKARMFGVFNAYEQQVIYDWIAGDASDKSTFVRPTRHVPQSPLTFEAKQRLRVQMDDNATGENDFDSDVRALEASLAQSETQGQTMALLIRLMSPANHHSAAGLKATRVFNELFD